MHWTALMAKRYFPAHAKVADDLACIDCGYNLRTLMANAKCPECGLDVGNSLFVLAKPHVVADGLRTAAKTYLALPIMLLALLVTDQLWPLIVSLAVVAFASAWRLLGISQLYFRGALIRLPVIGPRLRVWTIIAIFDLLSTLTALVTVIVIAKNTAFWNPTGERFLRMTVFAWLTVTMLAPFIAAMFGYATARMVGYNWMIVEFFIFQIAAAAGVIAALLLGVMLSIGSGVFGAIAAGVLLLLMAFSVIFTWIALTHLGNAADETSGTWEELIDSDRVEIISDPPEAVRREPTAVPLSPGKPRPPQPPSPNPKPRVADT